MTISSEVLNMGRNVEDSPITLSVIVPCFNELDVIEETNRRLRSSLEPLNIRFEVIYIDDGSSDGTFGKLQILQSQHSFIRIIAFSRNFGQQAAISAGLASAAGDAVVIIDADLQDPPELIKDFIAKWREGYQVVYAFRAQRLGENWFKLITASLFYRFQRSIIDFDVPVDTGEFRLIDRCVVDALNNMPERRKFIRGLVAWIGYKQIGIPYVRNARYAGYTKYTVTKMIRLAKDAIFSFSISPLHIASYLGTFALFAASISILFAIGMKIATAQWPDGWKLVTIAIAFFSGVQLLTLGVIGEYIGMMYSKTKQRPTYIVKTTLGFEQKTTSLKQHKKHDLAS